MVKRLTILAACACRHPEPAPPDLEGEVLYFWSTFDQGGDDWPEHVDVFDDLIAEETIEIPSDGTLKSLDSADVDDLAPGNDPSTASGLFIANEFDCSIADLRAILSYPDQLALYPSNYDTYVRTFQQSRSEWLSGDIERLDADVEYDTTVLGAEYSAAPKVAFRRFDDAVVSRVVMPEPAEFESGNKSITQDYQLEVYWAVGGKIRHIYGFWRDADFGGAFVDESATVQTLVVDGLFDWDDVTEQWCADGLPE